MYRVGGLPRFPSTLLIAVLLTTMTAACTQTSAQQVNGGRTGRGAGGRGGRGGGAQPVTVAAATRKDVPVEISAVGNVEASTTIAVRSQITGVLEQVGFREGDFVKKGSVLFTIDRRPLEAALEQSEANLVRDKSLVSQAEAQLARDASTAQYQAINADRQSQLVERGIVARDAGDQARSQAEATTLAVKADRAAVESAQAQLKVQQAAVDAARVQLGYTVVHSPIDGRTGDLAVKPGNLVSANTSQLSTIVQVEPIFVTFSVPEVHLATIKNAAAAGRPLKVVAVPQDGDPRPVEGRLTFWDNVVDPATDSIKLKATIANTDHRLWPGQFARVTLELQTIPNATVIPQQALQIGQEGAFVFALTDKSTVEQRPVTAGQRVGDDIVIEKGIQPGDRVVTAGQLRLEDGTRVQIADANGTPAAGREGRSGRGGRGGRSGRRGGDSTGGSGASTGGTGAQ